MNKQRKNIKLKEALAALQKEVDAAILTTKVISADKAVAIMIDFFEKVQIQGLDETNDGDMLLFQYGNYDWQDGKGFNFEMSLVRQLILPRRQEDELYQLELRLLYQPEAFQDIEAITLWKEETLELWQAKIMATKGFKRAVEQSSHHFTIQLQGV